MTRVLRLALCLVLVAGVASAQATSTFNGRVLDQGDAVLPGVTVTATNLDTGRGANDGQQRRRACTSCPGSSPASTTSRRSCRVRPATRERVTLGCQRDDHARLHAWASPAWNEAVTVTGEAPLIEVTQSKVASSIEATELQNLPMITRTVSGMLALLPGAAPMAPIHRSKENVGSVSFGGGSGTNVIPTVDGADNRDNHYGGPLLTFTTESLEQFQLATSQFTAADGRTGGAALTMVTKSGTNLFHGSGVPVRARRGADREGLLHRSVGERAGGPVQPPAVRRLARRAAPPQPRCSSSAPYETVYEDTVDSGTGQPVRAARAARAGDRPPASMPHGAGQSEPPARGADSDEPQAVHRQGERAAQQQPLVDGALRRPARQSRRRHLHRAATTCASRRTARSGCGAPSVSTAGCSATSGLNQITAQVNHLYRLSDVDEQRSPGSTTRGTSRTCRRSRRGWRFRRSTPAPAGRAARMTDTYVIQIKDDVSLLRGQPRAEVRRQLQLPARTSASGTRNEHFPTLTFFDDPSVILSNSNGRYPQGFQTPGIVRQWQQANTGASPMTSTTDAQQFATWFQDDWRATSQPDAEPRHPLRPRLQLLRSGELREQRHAAGARGDRQPVQRQLPKTPTKNISPRVGFAYDLSGDGRRVLRGGYGLYFDQFNTGGAA